VEAAGPRKFGRWARMAVTSKIERMIMMGILDGEAAGWKLEALLFGADFDDRIRAHMAGKKIIGGHLHGAD